MKDNFISTIPQHLIPYQLPKNWKWFYWSDLMTNFQQGMIRSISQLGNGNSEYLKMGDLDANGHANFSRLAKTEASQKEINEFSLKEGDFLINVRNSKELVGKTCVIEDIQNRVVLFNHMLVRIEHANIEMNYFVNAFLNVPSTKKMVDRIKQGTTTVIALYQRDLNKLPIALPDNLTFYQIVKLYKDINSKIELNNNINTELEAMVKTLYDYWFVQFDFPDSNGKPYKSAGGKMVWNAELKRVIPEGWEDEKIENIVEIISGNVSPKEIDSNTPYIGLEHIPRRTIILSEWKTAEKVNSDKCLFKKHDILFGKIRPYFHKVGIAFIDGITSTDTIVLRPRKNSWQGFALQTVFTDDFVETATNSSTGTKMPRANWNVLKNYPIAFPSNKLLDIYQLQFNNVIKKIEFSVLENQELTTLRDWLLPMLMNGQVRLGDVAEELGMVAEASARYGK
jgi:type I restriction enzyme S subunit